MTKKKADTPFDKAVELFSEKKYEQAIELWKQIDTDSTSYPNAQFNIGLSYEMLGSVDLSAEHYSNIQKEDNPQLYAKAQFRIGYNLHDLTKKNQDKAVIHYKNVEEKDSQEQFNYAQYNLGDIAFNQHKKDDAINYYQKISPEYRIYYKALQNIRLIEDGSSKLCNSSNDIYDQLYPFLRTTFAKNKIKDREALAYETIFDTVTRIIEKLHVQSTFEKKIAHYTTKNAVEHILFQESPLRLSSVIGANDPQEGETLLHFLKDSDEDSFCTKTSKEPSSYYRAFISCFTFDHESLNQFRLYGKENNLEATGVSIILDTNFFSSQGSINIGFVENPSVSTTTHNKPSPDNKLALYRCIYIDPETHRVISVGQKEKYSLYREGYNDKEIEQYQNEIEKITKSVVQLTDQLRKDIKSNKNLDYDLVCELLLPLRYLAKHVAFKEEQECRIFDIEDLTIANSRNKIFPKRDKLKDTGTGFHKMYVEYPENVSKHIEKIIFAPHTQNIEQFESFIRYKYKSKKIVCTKSKHPFAIK